MIGGNLAFGMGDGELTNQHPAWEILQEILWEIVQEMLQEILQKILWEILQEILWEMAWGNSVGNGLGNDAVFSLNTWLRMIYCLQTIHEPACVILKLFNICYFHTEEQEAMRHLCSS